MTAAPPTDEERLAWLRLARTPNVGPVAFDHLLNRFGSAGAALAAGSIVGEVESTKSVGELYAPLDGEVVEANGAVVDAPETINSDPYGDGWLVKVRISSAPTLLSADEYRALIGE